MISKNMVLQKLAPFTNFKKVLIEDQNTGDIIQGILDNHNNYEKEYDKISEMFIGDNEVETAKNIFKFLKDNVPYYVEPIEKQTLRSPSAILSMKDSNGQILGADCKSYASFINGTMSSLNRKGIFKVPLSYRFASYRYDTREPQHVFSVLYPNTKNEVWVDPVLNKFDQRKEPVYIKDKKIKMALIAMSGTTNNSTATLQEMQDYRDKLVSLKNKYLNSGVITPGSQEENQYIMAIDKVTKCIQMASISGMPSISGNIGDIDWGNIFGKLVDTGASLIQKNNQPSYGGGYQYPVQQPTASTGISTNTLLLVGAAGLGLYLILRRK
jgi:hypothetical protein